MKTALPLSPPQVEAELRVVLFRLMQASAKARVLLKGLG